MTTVRQLTYSLATALSIASSVGAAEAGRFQAMDGDRDGTINKREAAANTATLDNFTEIDRDGDGRLDAREFAGFDKKAAVSGFGPQGNKSLFSPL